MFVQERQDLILSLVKKNGKVLVKDLSVQFGVTEDCIRKDLQLLEKKGLLKRTYGGAVPIRVNLHQEDVVSRKDRNIAQKQVIAEKALKLVQNGDVLFLDISTSNIELVKMLLQSDMEVTVATNMVETMRLLTVPSKIDVIFIGGMFTRSKDGFVGTQAIEAISRLRFDIAFLGTVGIDLNSKSVYTYLIEDGYTKEAIVKNSRKNYAMCEGAKFSLDGNFKYASLDSFNGIITDSEIDDETVKQLNKLEIQFF